MSALPKAVQKQIEEANRIGEEIQRSLNPTPEGAPPAGETKEEPPKPAETQPTQGAQTVESNQEPAPAPQPDGFEQKYRVLQGKYNAEVPRLTRTVGELQQTVEQLRGQLTATQGMLASLGQQRAAAPSGDAATPAAGTKLVKDEEIRDFGPDLYDFIKRAAQEAVLPQVDTKLRPVQQKVEQVASTASRVEEDSAHAKHDRLLNLLDVQVPNWRALNKDQTFLDWLDGEDPYTGQVRGVLLKQAYQRFDGPRVAAFFKGFQTEHAVVTPQPPAPAQGSQRKLEEFTAPGPSKTGTTGAPNEAGKRIWTQAQIKQFYDDAAQGKYKSRQDEYRAMEREFVAAAREGRVR